MKYYFDENKVLSKISIEFINRGWTINFKQNDENAFAKMKTLILALIKTEDMD